MACSCTPEPPKKAHGRFRIALWIAFAVNLLMFFVELWGGTYAHSASLWADALDFLGDSINYAVSLAVLGLSLYWRATVALFKGITMAIFALFILVKAGYVYHYGIVPEAITMGIIGFFALCANVFIAVILYRFREGDSNMKSVWLCSRNDAIGNVAVILAALGVFGTQSALPDLIVACIMAGLGLTAGYQIIKQANKQRRMEKVTLNQRSVK